jgi:hypothetical protein
MTIKCYVGQYKHNWWASTSLELEQAHPSEFQNIVNNLKRDVWSNNPLAINCFKAENIIVCGKTAAKPLNERPAFSEFKDIPNGEIWLLVGEKWVDE